MTSVGSKGSGLGGSSIMEQSQSIDIDIRIFAVVTFQQIAYQNPIHHCRSPDDSRRCRKYSRRHQTYQLAVAYTLDIQRRSARLADQDSWIIPYKPEPHRDPLRPRLLPTRYTNIPVLIQHRERRPRYLPMWVGKRATVRLRWATNHSSRPILVDLGQPRRVLARSHLSHLGTQLNPPAPRDASFCARRA